jgi:hypothetical protein
MVKFCPDCGAANPPDSLFCGKCGRSLTTAEPLADSVDYAPMSVSSDVIPTGLVEPATDRDSNADNSSDYPSEVTPKRPWLIPLSIAASLLVIAGLYYWLFLADDMRDVVRPEQAATEIAASVEPQSYFAMTEANIRDKPTTVDSVILGKMPRGSRVTGIAKLGADGKTNWLELSDGKGFVAMVNLTENEPPEIARLLNDKVWIADSTLDIWAAADTSSLLDRVSEGTRLTLSGLTTNDFIEVKLPKGGVGYLADGAAILARLGGKPIAISFNPQTCSFGGELGAEFAKIGSRLKAQWEALEDREFADDEAREKAYAAVEGRSSYVKLARSFNGLSLTAIGQHYESQSIYFADPPSKVVGAFRKLGFRIDANGNFPSTELYAGISATRGEGAAYGKSELGCGV